MPAYQTALFLANPMVELGPAKSDEPTITDTLSGHFPQNDLMRVARP
jgi:hypothetical protein